LISSVKAEAGSPLVARTEETSSIVRMRACWSSLGAGLAQHPAAQLERETGLLSDPHELVGRYHAAAGVLPADQRLHAHHPAADQLHLRLVLHKELHPVERAAEVGLEAEPFGRVRTHLLPEDLAASAARLLGAVHSHVGVPHHVLGPVAPAAAERQARAGGHEHLAAVGLHGRCERRGHAVGHRGGVLERGHRLEEEHELVAPGAGHRVLRPDAGVQAGGDLAQHVVAG
jgi:hypothetical protein